MSHFLTIVLLEPEHGDTEDAVARLMEPYSENGEWFREDSRWDWYQIGGRWTGWLDGYEPENDPQNLVTCDVCSGTGTRPDGLERFGQEWVDSVNGCNGCRGKGVHTAWPTEWAPHAGDVGLVEQVVQAMEQRGLPIAVVTPDGEWHEQARMGWWGMPIPDEEGNGEKPDEDWKAVILSLIDQWPDSLAVVVDAHV
jgi:hypothetical protein